MSETIDILSLVNLKEEQISLLTENNENIVIHQFKQGDLETVSKEILSKVSILLTWADLPSQEITPNLKWVHTLSAGVNTIIDNPLFKKSNIHLTTSSGANAPQVAEHTLALLLAMSRKITDLTHHQSNNSWLSTHPSQKYSPTDLMNSTVGILGYGSLGRQIARLLQPFNCKILVTKKDAKNIVDDGFILDGTGDKEGEFFTRLYPTEATLSVISESDFIIVTLPLTPATKGIINDKMFARMKPSAILVDVSRGGVVDHNALIGALVNNQIVGAALDVFPTEPLSNESSLWQFSNVLISPHVAGVSPEYVNRAILVFQENLNRHLNGIQLLNIVNTKNGY